MSNIDAGLPGLVNDVDGNGNTDYYISFSISTLDLYTFINAQTGHSGVDENTFLQMVVSNSQNLQQFNNDYVGVDGEPTLWTEGGLSTPTQVPEPATYALIFGALALAFSTSRRRK